jgi:hypothetical protein
MAQLALAGTAAAAVLAGCGGSSRDAGGLTAGERKDAQLAMNALQQSNIPVQLVGLSTVAGLAPAACRVHLVSRHPSTFRVYVFWVPFDRRRPYSWLDLTITPDRALDAFHLGTARPVDAAASSRAARARIDRGVLLAHSASTFTKPGADCQVLMNGYLKLLPTPSGSAGT